MPNPDHHATLLGRIRKNRVMIRCLRTDLLAGCLEQPCGDPWIRARIADELTIRAWHLAGRSRWTELPERPMIERAWSAHGLGPEVRAALAQWIDGQAQARSFDPPPAVAQSPDPFGLLLTHDLAQWRCADGLAFFASNGDDSLEPCTALPFMVDTSDGRREALVHTADHEPLRELEPGVRLAADAAAGLDPNVKRIPLCIVLLTVRGKCEGLLTGTSLSLPVLIAWQLKSWGVNPDVEHILSSGTLTQGSQLDPNAGSPRQLELKRQFMARLPGRMVVLPGYEAREDGRVRYWPCAQSLQAYFSELRSSLSLPKKLPDHEADDRLKKCDLGMRYGSMPARQALSLLYPLYEQYRQRKDIRGQRLRTRVAALLGAAECHSGNPAGSTEWSAKVLEDADAAGPLFTAQTLIRQAVAITDQGRYSDAVALCDTALEQTGRIHDLYENKDIQLQACGTKGQALAYWGLYHENSKAPGLEALKQAVALARELDPEEPLADGRDLPRNLNYIALWHALHEPQSILPALTEAQEAAGSDLYSLGYLKRIRWLAAYRAALKGLRVDCSSFENDLPDPQAANGWLYAMSLKYRGTLRSIDGRAAEAVEDFSMAAKRFTSIEKSPLLGFLGATADLQAGECLMSRAPSTARKHLESALRIFSQTTEWFEGPIKGCLWAERAAGILAERSPRSLPNPQTFYPY